MSQMFKVLMDNHTDSFGTIVQTDGDGGDSLNRHGLMGVALYELSKDMEHAERSRVYEWILATYPQYKFEGKWRRHPDTTKWYASVNNVSRDQMIPNIVAWGLLDSALLTKYLSKFWVDHTKRWYRFPNTEHNHGQPGIKSGDLTGPSHFMCIFRARKINLWARYILDWFLLVDVLVHCAHARLDETFADDLNLFVMLLQTRATKPTWMSRCACYMYKKLRPRGIQWAFDHYFRPQSWAPPFNELFREIIRRF